MHILEPVQSVYSLLGLSYTQVCGQLCNSGKHCFLQSPLSEMMRASPCHHKPCSECTQLVQQGTACQISLPLPDDLSALATGTQKLCSCSSWARMQFKFHSFCRQHCARVYNRVCSRQSDTAKACLSFTFCLLQLPSQHALCSKDLQLSSLPAFTAILL